MSLNLWILQNLSQSDILNLLWQAIFISELENYKEKVVKLIFNVLSFKLRMMYYT